MDESQTQATEGGTDMAERYTGPSARRIADLLPHRVSFETGLVLDDDGHLPRRKVGRAGVSGSDRTARESRLGATPGAAHSAW